MTDFTPPTDKEVIQSNDPVWLRDQADRLEVYTHKIAEKLRDRADMVEANLRIFELTKDKDRIGRALGANEIKLKKMRSEPNV